MREEAKRLLLNAPARLLVGPGFIGTNRLQPSAANRKSFAERLESEFQTRLRQAHQTATAPVNLTLSDIEILLDDPSIPVISSTLAARTLLRHGTRDHHIDLLLEQLAQDRFAVCLLNLTQPGSAAADDWISVILLQPLIKSANPHQFLVYVCNSQQSHQSSDDKDHTSTVAALIQTLRLYAQTQRFYSELFLALVNLETLGEQAQPGTVVYRSLWAKTLTSVRLKLPDITTELHDRMELDLNAKGLSLFDLEATTDSTIMPYIEALSADTIAWVQHSMFVPTAKQAVKHSLALFTTFMRHAKLDDISATLKNISWANWQSIQLALASLPALVRAAADDLWRLVSSQNRADLGLLLQLQREDLLVEQLLHDDDHQ